MNRQIEAGLRMTLLAATLAGCTRVSVPETATPDRNRPVATQTPDLLIPKVTQEAWIREGTSLPIHLLNMGTRMDYDAEATSNIYSYFHDTLPDIGIPLILNTNGKKQEAHLLVARTENPRGVTHTLFPEHLVTNPSFSQTRFQDGKPQSSFSHEVQILAGSSSEKYIKTSEALSSYYVALEACNASINLGQEVVKSTVCNYYAFAIIFKAQGKSIQDLYDFMRETGLEKQTQTQLGLIVPITQAAWDAMPTTLPLKRRGPTQQRPQDQYQLLFHPSLKRTS